MRVSVVITKNPDVEVIVVHGGWTDDSAAVIRRYDGRVMELMRPTAARGAAVNAGFAASTGDPSR